MADIIVYLAILIMMPIMFIASYLTKNLLLKHDLGPFKPFINALRFIGVCVHELAHAAMCIKVGTRPKAISVKLRSPQTGDVAPHGHVKPDDHKMTFLQATLAGLAPLIFGAWLFFWCFTLAFTEVLDVLLRIIAGVVCIALLLGCAPSVPDLKYIGHYFKKDPKYSMYQIFLVFLSGIVVWFILLFYKVNLPLDLFFFILVGVFYYPTKYTLAGFNKLIHCIHFKKSSSISYKSYTKKRFKPAKPHEIRHKS